MKVIDIKSAEIILGETSETKEMYNTFRVLAELENGLIYEFLFTKNEKTTELYLFRVTPMVRQKFEAKNLSVFLRLKKEYNIPRKEWGKLEQKILNHPKVRIKKLHV